MSDPPPGNQKPPPKQEPPKAAGGVTFTAASLSSPRLLTGHAPPADTYPRGTAGAPLSTDTASVPASPPMAPPDDAKVKGAPEASRPDQLTALPADRPGHYTSPKPLEELKATPKPASFPETVGSPEPEEAALNMSAFPAAFHPAPTEPMADEVPESGVTDPSQLGSYHIQVSTANAFEGPLYDKTYPFMADIDLPSDLLGRRTKPGVYWVRYALVDLLGFQHPYTRPQRALLEAKR